MVPLDLFHFALGKKVITQTLTVKAEHQIENDSEPEGNSAVDTSELHAKGGNQREHLPIGCHVSLSLSFSIYL